MIREGIKNLSEAERKIKDGIRSREIAQQRAKLEELEKKRKRDELNRERMARTLALLEKYPEELFLVRYTDYLRIEAKSMGLDIKGLNIVGKDGEETPGHRAERDFLNDVQIGPHQRILALRDKSEKTKRKVFADLVEYYGGEEFQKDEACKLEEFTSLYLYRMLSKRNSIEDVSFKTAVGTPLDFNFGIDGWVEIEDEDGHIEKIFFDLKTGDSRKDRPSPFADLVFKVDESDGKIDVENETNVFKIKKFLDQVVKIYENRKKDN